MVGITFELSALAKSSDPEVFRAQSRVDRKAWTAARIARLEVEASQLVHTTTTDQLREVLTYRDTYRRATEIFDDFKFAKTLALARHGEAVITAYIRGDFRPLERPVVMDEIDKENDYYLKSWEAADEETREQEQAEQEYEEEQARRYDK